MEKPLVTVVTATYKNFTHLKQTIHSVLAQTYLNIQYIITDDASENFPETEIRDYIDDNNLKDIEVLIIHHNENLGTVKNMNYAYKNGKGDFFINLSCGDVFFNDMVVEKIVERFLLKKCNVLVTSRMLYKGDFEPVCLLPHLKERNVINNWKTNVEQYKALITGMFYDMASGSAMHFSRKILEQMGYFDETYTLWEDGPFLTKYLQKERLECAYEIVSVWYESGGVSDGRDKNKSKVVNAKSKLMKDILIYDQSERIERFDLLTNKERRIVEFRLRRNLYYNSMKRFLLLISYFPECIACRRYSKNRRRWASYDRDEINRLISNNTNSKGD